MADPLSMAAILGGAGQAAAGIGGLFGSLFGDDGEDELRRAQRLFGEIPRPQFDFGDVTAPEFGFVGDVEARTFQPTLPDAPVFAGQSDFRNDQIGAIGDLQAAIEGLTEADRLRLGAINEDLATGANRNQLALEQQLLGRGRLGAGDSVQLGILNAQEDRQLRGELGRSMQEAVLQRAPQAAALRAQIAGQARSQDELLNQVNAGIRNRFNEVVSGLLTGAAQTNTAAENLAAFQNRDLLQQQSNLRDQARMTTDFANLENQNQLRQLLANFDLNRAGGQAGTLGAVAQREQDQQTAFNQTLGNVLSGLGQGVGGIFDINRQNQAAEVQRAALNQRSFNPQFDLRAPLHPLQEQGRIFDQPSIFG